MAITRHNPTGLFPPYLNYAHAVEVPPGARTLYLGDQLAARTVMVQQLLEPEWLIEVEAIAAKVG
jgi:enamine deaminase RidA (YjgF/YER057c/UK114 family)